MEAIVRCIGDLLAETWRLVRLVCVGVAWSMPVVFSNHIYLNPDLSPVVARIVERVSEVVPYAAPAFAIIGICVVAALLPPAGHRGAISLAVPIVLFVPPLAAVVLMQSPDFAPLLSVGFIIGLLSVPVGLAVTFVALWRRFRWLAPVWLLIWIAYSELSLRAGQLPDGYPHIGMAAGLGLILNIAIVLLVSVLAAGVAYVATGLRGWMRALPDTGGPI